MVNIIVVFVFYARFHHYFILSLICENVWSVPSVAVATAAVAVYVNRSHCHANFLLLISHFF